MPATRCGNRSSTPLSRPRRRCSSCAASPALPLQFKRFSVQAMIGMVRMLQAVFHPKNMTAAQRKEWRRIFAAGNLVILAAAGVAGHPLAMLVGTVMQPMALALGEPPREWELELEVWLAELFAQEFDASKERRPHGRRDDHARSAVGPWPGRHFQAHRARRPVRARQARVDGRQGHRAVDRHAAASARPASRWCRRSRHGKAIREGDYGRSSPSC